MRVDTFVFVHDQDIVLDFDRIGKFNSIENLRYVFLGARPVDRISGRPDVIVARDFEDNIENLASFVAFTGWHLIWKNNLSDADYINLFEYDVDLKKGFSEEQRMKLDGVDVMGYVPLSVHDYWYIGDEACTGSLLRSFNSRYGIDYRQMVNSMGDEIVGLTSNQTFSKAHFDRFMSWFEEMIPDLQDDPMCGHMPERAVSIYCRTNGASNVSIEPDLLAHYRLDSHGTGQRDREEVAGYYKKMIGE